MPTESNTIFFFASSSTYLPPTSPGVCICLKRIMQPANWTCVKDLGSSIQAFTGFLEYRNVWKFHNETLFVNSKQHVRFCICTLPFTILHLQKLMNRPALCFPFFKSPIQTLSIHFMDSFPGKKNTIYRPT